MDGSKRDILRRVRVFADLADADLDRLASVLRARRGAPGDTLFRQGDPGESLMIVLEGELVAKVKTGAGGEEEIARLGPGEVVGELAFLDAAPRSATVSTPRGATVIDFTRAALDELSRAAPKVAAAIQRNVLGDVARRLRDVGIKLTDASSSASLRPRSTEPPKRSGRDLTAAQLRTVPALAGYPIEDLELLSIIATLRSFAPGAVLMEEGAAGDGCFLLVAGEVSVARKGSMTALAVLGPGALVGQLALLDRAPRAATVTATKETMALEVRPDAFANLLGSHTPVALRFQRQVAMAGARQLRAATVKFAEAQARLSESPMSVRMIDDWDDGGPELELAVPPASIRRPRS